MSCPAQQGKSPSLRSFGSLLRFTSMAHTYDSMSSPNSPTLSPLSTPADSPSSFVHALSPTSTVFEPNFIVLPDINSYCPFSPTFHDDGDAVSAESLNWLLSGSPHFSQKKVTAMSGLQAGALTAYCYNDCPSGRLRLICDFLNFLFHLDDVSDGYLARDAEGLANIVMNAFEWPDSFRPLPGQPDGVEENNAGKLARK
jgi:alpha-muurolene/germacrene-A/gamma-muurolene synthase